MLLALGDIYGKRYDLAGQLGQLGATGAPVDAPNVPASDAAEATTSDGPA
jgi:hypothetical protein